MKTIHTYKAYVAKENDIQDVSAPYALKPDIETRLVRKIKESSSLLQHVNFVPVTLSTGTTGILPANGPYTSRTRIQGGQGRVCTELTINPAPYKCIFTEFDVIIPYSALDLWAGMEDFYGQIEDVLTEQQGLEQIMIGFNGTHAADHTDIVNYPLLEDVNKGWLQKIRDNAPSHVVQQATIGTDGDYASLDALAYAATQKLTAPNRDRPGLVVIISRDTLHTKLSRNIDQSQDNVSHLALQSILATRTVAGLPVFEAPYMPDGAMLITSLNNLSIYYQKGAHRHFIRDSPDADGVQFFRSRNEDYVVEDYDRAVLVEGIEFLEQVNK